MSKSKSSGSGIGGTTNKLNPSINIKERDVLDKKFVVSEVNLKRPTPTSLIKK